MFNKYTYSIIFTVFLFSSEMTVAEERNNYFFLNFAGYSVDIEVVNNVEDFKKSGAAAIFGYGRAISDYVAIEIAINSYNEVKDELQNLERKGLGGAIVIQGVGMWPVSDYFKVFAKAGASNWKYIVDIEGADKETIDGTDVIYGAGIALDADHDSTIRLEYDAYLNGLNVDFISLGFQHNF